MTDVRLSQHSSVKFKSKTAKNHNHLRDSKSQQRAAKKALTSQSFHGKNNPLKGNISNFLKVEQVKVNQ